MAIASGCSALLILVALAGLQFDRPQFGQLHVDQPDAAAAPLAARVANSAAEAAGTDGARSYSYYPEQLAALHSMSNFTPIADGGLKPEPPAVFAVKGALPSARVSRRSDAPVKAAALQIAIPSTQADPQPPSQDQPKQDVKQDAKPKIKFFGVPLPGLPDLGQGVKSARDAATNWGAAAAGLGSKIAGLWH